MPWATEADGTTSRGAGQDSLAVQAGEISPVHVGWVPRTFRLLILVLLEQEAAHGYELIKTIEERSGGFYSPSPGVIYPALTFLEEVHYARSEQESTRKLYHITSEGRSPSQRPSRHSRCHSGRVGPHWRSHG